MRTLVFIGGSTRSGSTLLERILGQLPGVVTAGEVRYVWERGFLQNELCGCGEPFRECSFWRNVLDRLSKDERIDLEAVIRQKDRIDRVRYMPAFFTMPRTSSLGRRLADHRRLLGRLFDAICSEAGCETLVDASKDPSHAWIATRIPGFRFKMLHLVRDPRATTHSWLRTKQRRQAWWASESMHQRAPLYSAMDWAFYQFGAECTRPFSAAYLRVRYEDLVRSPRAVMANIIRSLDLGPPDALPFEDERRVHLSPTHAVGGNPDRFDSGTIAIRADLEWERELAKSTRRLVTALCWPFLRRYGYSAMRNPREREAERIG